MKNVDDKPNLKPLTHAIILTSGIAVSGVVTAGTYTATVSGAITEHSRNIVGVPGITPGYNPPLIQNPRLAPYGGPGWAATLRISIDSESGAVVDFEETTTTGYVVGHPGIQAEVHSPGQRFVTGVGFPMPQCGVTSANAGETGTIVYACPIGPSSRDLPIFASRIAPGYRCATPTPSSTNFSGGNGCRSSNAGVTFPGGIPNFQAPQATAGAHVVVHANSADSLTGTHPDYYATNDPSQVFNGVGLYNFERGSMGGDFTIKHTGTFSAGNFAVASVDFYNRRHSTFEGTQFWPTPEIFDFNRGQYTTAGPTKFTPGMDELGKGVPAMGTMGLSALFAGLVAIAARLRRRFRLD